MTGNRHIAITTEDLLVAGGPTKRASGAKEVAHGNEEPARETYLTDGCIEPAVACCKRTAPNPEPRRQGYGLDRLGAQVKDTDAAQARATNIGAATRPPARVDLANLSGRIFFERECVLAGVQFDLPDKILQVASA
ncbi:MAG: hypothetical protein A3G25_16480 [Betaproteobacteria bacterium RIFCSPLOWO2_12_FULL_63_13]|nr:MAG: hypothetical protein A3G25_16480 [Betaproteobacteria bacterium RIFCSPLOWO2_12_FULL_63_13]